MRPLVILRPEPGSSTTARAAVALGLYPLVIPLFVVGPVEWVAPDPGGFDALLLTSANAIRHGGAKLERVRDLPAVCVGEGTAAAASNAGFRVAKIGASGVDSLLQSLPREMRLLHLCGADRRAPDAPLQVIESVTVYDAAEIPSPAGIDRLATSVVAVHSPRAASRLAELVDASGLERGSMAVAAISAETAAAAGNGWHAIEAAAEPSDSALLALASRLCHNL